MATTAPHPETARVPDAFRAGLAELFEIGMSVARMVRAAADAEVAVAAAAVKARAAGNAMSHAEAIEMDKALQAASQPQDAVERTVSVAAAYNQVARAVRRTALLAERFDRGWARRGGADDSQAMAHRQIVRGVAEAIGREASGERVDELTEALADRMDAPETLDEIGHRPAEAIIQDICRDLGVGGADAALSRASRERAGVRAALPGAACAGRGLDPGFLPIVGTEEPGGLGTFPDVGLTPCPNPLPRGDPALGVTPSRGRPPPDRTFLRR